ncbi:hypothetical protein WR25_04314 [Diploscapter pachys]|uniref:Uncharacterized protein n=1 Tax=Diploscapter pachys TaxID=2018661 RepID=A0A2A2JIY5_9BILA|nr:hypothetical protein WR25_04314 [Diploscapter pachys]
MLSARARLQHGMQLNFACVEFLQWLAPTWFENKKAKKASTIRREPREIRKCESLRRFSSIESIDSAYDAALVKEDWPVKSQLDNEPIEESREATEDLTSPVEERPTSSSGYPEIGVESKKLKLRFSRSV